MSQSEEIVITTAGSGSEADLRHAQRLQPGEILIRLKSSGTFTVEVRGQAVLSVAAGQDGVRIDLGAAASERLVLGDSFRSFLNDFLQTKFDAHVHPIPSGQVTAPPHAAFVGAQMPEELLSRVAKVR